MKTIVWRRSRVVRFCGVALCLIFVGFLILIRNNVSTTRRNLDVPEKERQERKVPFIRMEKLGNFEPQGTPEPVQPSPLKNLTPDLVQKGKKMQAQFGMNMAVSDLISMERAIPDTRMPECKHWNYPENMGLRASIVIIFYNEGFSAVMRNVHTVISRSPPELFQEVILVDDASENEDMKDHLDQYIRREQFEGKVKVVRNAEREGLIRARVIGAKASVGDVVVFLDAHCEVNANWLPPLLAPIYRDRRVSTVPFIDGINYDTFEYRPVYGADSLVRGIFEWGLLYKETDVSPEMERGRPHRSAPYKSPTNAGGLFAIEREYFFELGGYDPGLELWGGENYDLSFKIWQCGGSIEWVPCSRVGHVYRGPMSPKPAKVNTEAKLQKVKKGPLTLINYKRVIEVWWEDKYKEFFYTREPLARFLDHGDISQQLAIKEKFKCKSFQWFMDNVASDLLIKYPEPPPNLYWGQMRNSGSNSCLDTMSRPFPAEMGVSGCHGLGGTQLLRLNTEGQLGLGERCVDVQDNLVKLIVCQAGKVNGPWKYDKIEETLLHTRLNKCLAVDPSNDKLILRDCQPNNLYQKWNFQTISPKY